MGSKQWGPPWCLGVQEMSAIVVRLPGTVITQVEGLGDLILVHGKVTRKTTL